MPETGLLTKSPVPITTFFHTFGLKVHLKKTSYSQSQPHINKSPECTSAGPVYGLYS